MGFSDAFDKTGGFFASFPYVLVAADLMISTLSIVRLRLYFDGEHLAQT